MQSMHFLHGYGINNSIRLSSNTSQTGSWVVTILSQLSRKPIVQVYLRFLERKLGRFCISQILQNKVVLANIGDSIIPGQTNEHCKLVKLFYHN
jgi:hypothetical protein